MWYSSPMLLTDSQLDDLLATARASVANAQAVRKHHAKQSKRGTSQRTTDIELALERLAQAMKPLRREIGRLPFRPDYASADLLREASAAIQSERRKLWKMNQKRKRRN